ncbi:MAG: tetratricopeptide repeat protein [Usitatibacter sp.]
MNAPTRRNDPCPCGSGLRYKECHGRLGTGAPSAPPTGVGALVQSAVNLHQQGRIDEAERLYREILLREPGNAIATHYLGMVAWHRGDLARGEQLMRESIATDSAVPDFHNNLGLLLRDTRRPDEAIACFRKTLEVDPGWIEAFNNLGLTLEALGRSDEAVAAYREAIARAPRFAAAHQNLGRALIARGDFHDGWEHYRWRLAAQGLAAAPPEPRQERFAVSLAGRRIVLRAEQGLGDVLFFLRFAPELARRGARLAFRGDTRLHPLLERTGLFALGVDHERAPAAGLEAVFIGDLPWLLAADDPRHFPAPLALSPQPERVERLRASFQALGPRPWVALTWRAGTTTPGPVRTQLKEIAPAQLGRALRAHEATWISAQRLPRGGEREALADALGAPVHDASAANDDLEEILALLGVVDGYVGVSSANTHLRAALGASMQVLVPYPPEWRWGLEGSRSPWFPTVSVLRQDASGRWDEALASLKLT